MLLSFQLYVAEDFHCKPIAADVKEFCRCAKCQRINHVLQKPTAELHSIPVSNVWERLGVDLVGPVPETKAGNKYIITLVDYFSKLSELTSV